MRVSEVNYVKVRLVDDLAFDQFSFGRHMPGKTDGVSISPISLLYPSCSSSTLVQTRSEPPVTFATADSISPYRKDQARAETFPRSLHLIDCAGRSRAREIQRLYRTPRSRARSRIEEYIVRRLCPRTFLTITFFRCSLNTLFLLFFFFAP